jgi:Domain of unknown function (DUF4189)
VTVARLLLGLLFLACSGTALAEGRCPPGYFPSSQFEHTGCAPVYDASDDSSASYESASPPDPGPRWEYRWGAIAVDGAKGKFGGADDLADVRKARKAAIKLCRKYGGKKCKIEVEYYNQCGTLVWGSDKYVTYRGSVPDEIIKRGMESCNRLTSNCQVVYMGCSYPVEG